MLLMVHFRGRDTSDGSARSMKQENSVIDPLTERSLGWRESEGIVFRRHDFSSFQKVLLHRVVARHIRLYKGLCGRPLRHSSDSQQALSNDQGPHVR